MTYCEYKILLYNVHYSLIDYDQQFAAIDQVYCRKVSFINMRMHLLRDGPVRQLRKLKRWARNCYNICYTAPSDFSFVRTTQRITWKH